MIKMVDIAKMDNKMKKNVFLKIYLGNGLRKNSKINEFTLHSETLQHIYIK